jgi:hypothetical protein
VIRSRCAWSFTCVSAQRAHLQLNLDGFQPLRRLVIDNVTELIVIVVIKKC